MVVLTAVAAVLVVVVVVSEPCLHRMAVTAGLVVTPVTNRVLPELGVTRMVRMMKVVSPAIVCVPVAVSVRMREVEKEDHCRWSHQPRR
uniref:Putative secreted protein n=1 Tax=Anopheles darlingi TaxID=43151 RepID=A0A2M4D183_ANODA